MFTDREREQLKTQHKQERDGRVRDRIKAVLLTDKGRNVLLMWKLLKSLYRFEHPKKSCRYIVSIVNLAAK